MSFELSQEFTFEAAHTLVRTVPLEEFTPSTRIHGHSYTATVTIHGNIGVSGMIERFTLQRNKREQVDLFYLRQEINRVRDALDHRFLNEVDGLGAPTLENLCMFIHKNIKGFPVSAVSVKRVTGGDSCIYRP